MMSGPLVEYLLGGAYLITGLGAVWSLRNVLPRR